MRREIKFRGWDGGKMYYHDDGMQHGNLTLCFNDISGWNFYYEGQGIYCCGASHLQKDVLMQYTGFKDRLKKEIYEGDILRQQKTKGSKFKVVWDKDGMWRAEMFDKDFEGMSGMLWSWAQNTEVIGNIYENHELLK